MSIDFSMKKHVLFDGAMGTMLQRSGLKIGEKPEELNITHPDIIYEIHREYLDAGSDVITTNTFGANEIRFSGSQYSVSDIVKSAVKIARDAAVSKLVALDIGPTGDFIEPLGTLSYSRAVDVFRRQVQPGAESGADLILIETFSDIDEARAAVEASKESNLPVFCTFTYGREGRTFMGYDIDTVVHSLEEMGVDALGVNCSVGPEDIIPIVSKMLKLTRLPLIVQPNAGLPEMRNGNIYYEMTPERFANYMKTMADMGVKFLGGCCGTDPDYIKEINRILNM